MLFALHRFSSHPALLVRMVQCEGHCTLRLAGRGAALKGCASRTGYACFDPWLRRPAQAVGFDAAMARSMSAGGYQLTPTTLMRVHFAI
jgi:hypothetical protein